MFVTHCGGTLRWSDANPPTALKSAGNEFIQENGGGAGVRLRNRRMKKTPTYLGYHIGIGKDGSVARVREYFDRGSVTLSGMNDDGVPINHGGFQGSAWGEVSVFFRVHESVFVHAGSEGGEYEKMIIEQIEAKAAEQREG